VERAIAVSVGADDALFEYIANKALLVLLDNFEQVIEAAPTVSALLAATPSAKLLVTSREPLHLESEQRYPVEPLPDDDAGVLFIERARAVAPGFRPTATIVEICRHVNGLPLAIELAAAHVALLDPDDLLARLEQRLPLLTSRSRDAPARQRTLRAAIEWSYELLELTEQDVFRRLAVFRGSFSLGAAEAICGADLDILESLVEKNLVRRWGSGRLGMLDTIGEYALERLDESPDAGAIHQRHGEFFLSLAESANLNAAKLDVRKPMRQDIANADQDNFRGAIAWAISSGSVGLGLKLASALEWFWVANDPAEGIRWFAGLLERPEAEAVQAEIRANALMGYGSSTDIAGHDEAAERLYEQSLALYQQLGDEHGRAVLLHRLGIQAMRRMELERARELVEASQAIHKRTGDRWGLTQTIGTLGAIARDTGDDTHAHELISQSAALARDVGVPWRESGMLAWWESGMLAELACLALDPGRIEEAEMHARDSLELAMQLEDRAGQVFGVGVSPASQSSAGSSSVPVTSRARSRMRTR
jgi:predicted ATPase